MSGSKPTYLIVLLLHIFLAGCTRDPFADRPSGAMPRYAASAANTVGEPPASVEAPFYGDFYATTASPGLTTAWYDMPGSTAHKRYTTFDDTRAYDLNLVYDLDQNLPVAAVASGKVISLGTTFPGTAGGGSYGAVLIDHGSWVSGYMHMRNISVKKGDAVTAGQVIGTVWHASPDGIANHLHFAAYGRDSKGYLTSRRVAFRSRLVTVALPQNVSLRVGERVQLSGRVSLFGGKYNIENAYYYNSTYWTSDAPAVASVDGNGRVTGKKKGITTTRLRFSGRLFLVSVTVR